MLQFQNKTVPKKRHQNEGFDNASSYDVQYDVTISK